MSKQDPLTPEEFAKFTVGGDIVAVIEDERRRLGLDRGKMNILDWGCGRGRAVLWLRERGYNALGVDSDPEVLVRGRGLLQVLGHPADTLRHVQPNGRTDFEDGFFHLILSQNVLEHVEDLDQVAREMCHITAEHGVGFHTCPARLRPIESHLRMPFVHWLPKSRARKAAIRAFVALGADPHWPELGSASGSERAETYYRYSRDKTFYRKPGLTRRSFEAAGFEVQFRTISHSHLTTTGARRFVARVIGAEAVGLALTHFGSPELLVRKPVGSAGAGGVGFIDTSRPPA